MFKQHKTRLPNGKCFASRKILNMYVVFLRNISRLGRPQCYSFLPLVGLDVHYDLLTVYYILTRVFKKKAAHEEIYVYVMCFLPLCYNFFPLVDLDVDYDLLTVYYILTRVFEKKAAHKRYICLCYVFFPFILQFLPVGTFRCSLRFTDGVLYTDHSP